MDKVYALLKKNLKKKKEKKSHPQFVLNITVPAMLTYL